MKVSRIIVPALLAAASLVAVPAVAADTAAQTAPTRAAGADTGKDDAQKGERLICKRFHATESRMKSFKACHTAEQWKRIDKSDF